LHLGILYLRYIASRSALWRLEYTKFILPGLCPGPRWGSSRRSPRPASPLRREIPSPHLLDFYDASFSAPHFELGEETCSKDLWGINAAGHVGLMQVQLRYSRWSESFSLPVTLVVGTVPLRRPRVNSYLAAMFSQSSSTHSHTTDTDAAADVSLLNVNR